MIHTILTIIIILCLVSLIMMYNKGISLRNYVREAFSTMDVYLKKRWDLVPNLVEIVKGYAGHEKHVLERVVELRNKSYSQLSSHEKLNINAELTGGLSRLIAIAENYPDLEANESFSQLSTQLTTLEDDIANARKYYNGTVRELNNYTEFFPSNVIALLFGIKPEKMFEIDEIQRDSIKVKI